MSVVSSDDFTSDSGESNTLICGFGPRPSRGGSNDLGDSAMTEYHTNVSPNYKLSYENINEKTGYDGAKFLVDEFYKLNPERLEMGYSSRKREPIKFPDVYTHSANPIGSANIMGDLNNFFMNEGKPQNCIRVQIPHTV